MAIEQMLTGAKNGGDVKIGGKTRKLISASGQPSKNASKKSGKKAHHKKVSKK